jgi:hypothetical protein
MNAPRAPRIPPPRSAPGDRVRNPASIGPAARSPGYLFSQVKARFSFAFGSFVSTPSTST